jgi:hypothetical protein
LQFSIRNLRRYEKSLLMAGADEVGIGIGTGRFGGAKKRHECPQGHDNGDWCQ